MTSTRRSLLAVAAACALAALLPVPASAVESVQSGWWSRGNGGGVPPPPGAPADGLQVAADPVGPSAVAAVRFALGDGEANPALTLAVIAADNPTSATLTACRAKARWTAAQGGPWSSRPDYDCSAGVVAGALSADQKSATFDLTSLVDDSGLVDVVLFTQPGAPPSGAPATPVSPGIVNFTFAKVSASAVHVDGGGAVDDATTPANGDAPAAEMPLDAGALTPTFDAPLVAPPAGPDLGLPPVAARGATAAPPTSAPPVALAAPAFQPAAVVHDDRRTRLVCAFVFADLALWWYWVTFRRADPAAVAAGADVRRAPPLR